ncbi:MAG: hypothetical protein K1X89_23325 [Myxococcaceae bacterium]|nr:hypothetical protein [Myxococcaceae bacterium]
MSQAEPKAPLLERVAVQYFQRRSAARPPLQSGDAVHFLNPEERAGMRRVVRGALIRAGVAGALSATASAVAEVMAEPLLPEGASTFSAAGAQYWAVLGGVTVVASVVEILFLYWDTVRSVHELSVVAGLPLFAPGDVQGQAVAQALARAALELPNPAKSDHGVDPRRESSKWMLLVASLAYKAKVGVTNFLVKLVVRRMLGRALARSVLNAVVPFAAVPITALWNALVSAALFKEARIRAMGPSAAHELVEVAFADAPALSEAGRLAAVRAVACAIVRTQDLHPNLIGLLEAVQKKAGALPRGAELDDPGEFLRALPSLDEKERRLAVRVLAVACVVDGRLARRERSFLQETFRAAGRSDDLGPVEHLCRAFVQGDGVADDAVRAL